MTVDVNVYDNVIPKDFQKEVFDYINSQTWIVPWKQIYRESTSYVPANETFLSTSHKIMSMRQPHSYMHRCSFAKEGAEELKENHPIILKLWELINAQHDNKYDITGIPEEVGDTGDWLVYCNGQPDETIKRSHGVHKDTIDPEDHTTRTILYIANLEWYPTWFAENVFYPDDIENSTGDHQQYQGRVISGQGWGQSRNFNVGWADQGKIVSPVPGRIISYDGRTLHTTRPTAIWAGDMRKAVVFRARLKPEYQVWGGK